MPGISLSGEMNSFAYDQELLGFCPHDNNEPAGDSFHDRCTRKIEGIWIDTRDPKGKVCLESDDEHDARLRQEDDEADDDASEDDDVAYDAENEVRGPYARFCAMNRREQERLIEETKDLICDLIGVSSRDWRPTTEFVLEAIQDETPMEELRQDSRRRYLGTRTQRPLGSSHADHVSEHADVIRVAQQGSSGKSETPQDFGLGRSYRTRCKESNSRKKKCWHSNRRETIRRNADFFLEDVGENHNFMGQYVGYESEGYVGEFLTVRDQMRLGVETELTLEQQLWWEDIQFREYEYESFAYYDSRARYRRPYRPFDDLINCTCLMCTRQRFPFSDLYDDFGYNPYDDWDWYVEPEDEVQDMIERFGDRFDGQDDIFAGFGETDADIDRIFPSFSSSGRFSYRFRGLSLRKQEALQR